MATHDIGDVVTVWAAFRDEDDAQVEPDDVALEARLPDGTLETVTPTAAGVGDEELAEAALDETLEGVTGVYRGSIIPTLEGVWTYRWSATGASTQAAEGEFYVRPQLVAEGAPDRVLAVERFEAVVKIAEDPALVLSLILREEDALRLLVGPLTGPVTQILYPPPWYDGPLTLRRFAPSVEVEDAAGAVDASYVRLISDGNGRSGGCIERSFGTWLAPVTVTYTPADAGRLERYLIEAVRAAIISDRERVVAEDRAGAEMHLATSWRERERLLAEIQPTVRTASVAPASSYRVTYPVP